MTSISLILWVTALVGCQQAERGRSCSPADATMRANPGSLAVQQASPVNVRLSTSPIQSAPSSNIRVVIYYFHPTLRCTSCLLAESLAHQVVQEQWKDAVDQGVLQWRLANIDLAENQLLTRLFAVDSSAVVVASVRDGKPVLWEKISQVWEQVQEPDTFRGRIHGQIMKFLSEE
jgi:hypothetical protein